MGAKASKVYANVYANDFDVEIENECTHGDCGYAYHSTRVAKQFPNPTRHRARCARACGKKVGYTSGSSVHPCMGGSVLRTDIFGTKGIDLKEKMHDEASGAGGAVQCSFKYKDSGEKDEKGQPIQISQVTDQALKKMSRDSLSTGAGMKDSSGKFMSIYEQLLWGFQKGKYTTKGQGYCEDVNNLEKVVDENGETCFAKLVKKTGEAAAKQKGIEYCKSNAGNPKCKCINVSVSGFVEFCRNNQKLPGCDEIVKGIEDFEKAGLKSATGLFGNADCIVPDICGGDVYLPLSGKSTCANKLAICNQVLSLDNIKAAAGIKAVQGCNINFDAEQKKKEKQAEEAEEAKKKALEAAKLPANNELKPSKVPSEEVKTPSEEGKTPSEEGKAVASKLPGGITTTQAGIGGGLSFLLSSSCVIVIIIIVMMRSGRRRG